MIFHLGQRQYSFKPRMGFLLLCGIFFLLFIALSIWQYHRYQFKKELLLDYQHRLASSPVPFLSIADKANDMQFQHVIVNGYYVNNTMMLIQNRFYQGVEGYEVLTPVQIPGQTRLLLVDRGWIARPKDKSLPTIDGIINPQHLIGHIKLLNEYQFILGKNILDAESLPIVMQKIDIPELSRLTHEQFYPYVLRLDVSSEDGLIRDWTITTILPERHIAYSIQWLFLALVLIIGFFCFSTERTYYE